jgi:TolB-like protein
MKLWQEIRRRRVFRFTGVYIVGAWLVFQVADVFFPAWGIPDSSLQFLLYAAFACFPIALVFSWFYDISSKGVTRTPVASATESVDYPLGRTDFLVLAGLLIVAGVIFYSSFDRVVQSVGTQELVEEPVIEKPENSLAVLPFESLDSNEDTGYFSNGVSEEIMHRLASIRSLKVIGRQSSFAFGEADMGLDKISDILGVRYLLNGSIRRAGDQVRVTARLVDDSGYQIWSETFDGDLNSIFTFQSDIAEQVASQITRELVILKSPVAAQRTENSEAYRLYLIGREYFHSRNFGWQDRAAEAYRHAITEDPDYAPPYAGLAIAIKMGADIEKPDSKWSRINELVDKALELDPSSGEAWMARGLTHTGEPGFDLAEDIEQLRYALELNPNLGMAYNFLFVALNWAGLREESREVIEAGLQIDPLNPPLNMNYAELLLADGDFTGWQRVLNNLLKLPEPPWRVYLTLGNRYADYGRFSRSIDWRKQFIKLAGPEAEAEIAALGLQYGILGLDKSADRVLDQLQKIEPDLPNDRLLELQLMWIRQNPEAMDVARRWYEDPESVGLMHPDSPTGVLAAEILIAGGEYRNGIDILTAHLDFDTDIASFEEVDSDDFRLLHLLAFACEKANQTDIQESAMAKAKKILELSKERTSWKLYPDMLMIPVLDFAASGNLGAAAQSLRAAVDAGWRHYHLERNNPAWRGAWGSDEFAPVVADILADLDRQRAEVEAIEATNDFRAEFENLISEQ